MKYVPYILIVAIALMIFTGFLVDEGGHLEARQTASTIAQDAARTGVDAVTGTAINGDAFQLSAPVAIAAADRYIAAANSGPGTGISGEARVDGDRLVVTVHTIYRTRFADWVGIDHLDAAGIAAAQLIDGN